PPPELPHAAGKERRGVEAAGRDGDGRGYSRDPHRRDGAERGGGGIAELSGVVASPALHGAVPEKRAGVEAPSTDGGGAADSGDRHRRRGVVRGPVAELARVVQPPAPHGPVLKERADVEGTGVDGGGR